MKIKQSEQLYDLLEAKYREYHRLDFIENDPLAIPHLFTLKEDIEISAFLAATIAWGQRNTIIKNAKRIISLMDNAPYDFIVNHEKADLKATEGFVHRTFNAADLSCFFTALKNIYINHQGLEKLFQCASYEEVGSTIAAFKQLFFSIDHMPHTEKHIADPLKGSSAKRINMFLRWMVRSKEGGVDFGIWKSVHPKNLMMPLDIHTGNVGRSLGLLQRKQNDWKAVEELTANLRSFDAQDPVKYDYALFGMGVNGDLP